MNLTCLLYVVLKTMRVQAHVFDFLSSHAMMTEYEHYLNETRLKETGRETERENSKTLFYKDCSLGSVKNLSNNYSLLSF